MIHPRLPGLGRGTGAEESRLGHPDWGQRRPRRASPAPSPTGSRCSPLGASAAGLAVCATAGEHGRTTPADWVPLLAQVLFGYTLKPTPAPSPDSKQSKHQLDTNQPDTDQANGVDPVS